MSGHETPVYVGLSRIILCTWKGSTNLTMLNWFREGKTISGVSKNFPAVFATYATLLETGTVNDISWNGRSYQCVAETTNGLTVTKSYTLWVKGNYTKIMEIHFR